MHVPAGVDLVFVEAAANLCGKADRPAKADSVCSAGRESVERIVRRLLRFPRAPAAIFVHVYPFWTMETSLSWRSPRKKAAKPAKPWVTRAAVATRCDAAKSAAESVTKVEQESSMTPAHRTKLKAAAEKLKEAATLLGEVAEQLKVPVEPRWCHCELCFEDPENPQRKVDEYAEHFDSVHFRSMLLQEAEWRPRSDEDEDEPEERRTVTVREAFFQSLEAAGGGRGRRPLQ